MEREPQNKSASQPESFDHRLACLKTAILEDWKELEAAEENGSLIIRVKEPAKQNHLAEAPEYRQIEKQRNKGALPEGGLVGTH
jgi:hypothetical protein